MNEKMTVSILIPTYNQASFIGDSILSALRQDYPDLEVIIGDDASTDSTEKVVSGFLDDPRLRYFRNETNLGRLGNYRRLLYDLAAGRYVLNLDGDDLLADSTYVDRCVEAIRSDEGILIAGGRREAFRSSDDVPAYRDGAAREAGIELFGGGDFVLRYWSGGPQLYHLTSLYDRDAALGLDFYSKDIVSSDIDSLLRLAAGGKVATLDCVGGYWRDHGANISKGLRVEEAAKNLAIVGSIEGRLRELGTLPEGELRHWRRKAEASRIFGIYSTQFADKGRRKEGRRFLSACAARYLPSLIESMRSTRLLRKIILSGSKRGEHGERRTRP